MGSLSEQHNRNMIDNALKRIDKHILRIRQMIDTNEDLGYTARYWCEELQSAFAKYADIRIVRRQPDMFVSISGPSTSDGEFVDIIADAFDKIHEHLYVINDFARRISNQYAAETVEREIGLLKAMRALRLHLEIPYDLHEVAA